MATTTSSSTSTATIASVVESDVKTAESAVVSFFKKNAIPFAVGAVLAFIAAHFI